MNKSVFATSVSKAIYSVLGLIFTGYGAYYLISPESMLAQPILEFSAEIGIMELVTEEMTHLSQELSAGFLTVGLLLFWAVFNLDKVMVVNYILLLFFLLISGIHWLEYLRGNREIISPLFNSIPLLLFLLVISSRNMIKSNAA